MLQLLDLNPQPMSWVKFINNQEVELNFRAFNLSDVTWLEQTFTAVQIASVFQNIDIINLCKIAYHQLTNDCKKILFDIKFEEIDEDGNATEAKYTGPERLMCLIEGNKINDLYDLMLKLRGISMDMVEKIESDPEVRKLLAQMK